MNKNTLYSFKKNHKLTLPLSLFLFSLLSIQYGKQIIAIKIFTARQFFLITTHINCCLLLLCACFAIFQLIISEKTCKILNLLVKLDSKQLRGFKVSKICWLCIKKRGNSVSDTISLWKLPSNQYSLLIIINNLYTFSLKIKNNLCHFKLGWIFLFKVKSVCLLRNNSFIWTTHLSFVLKFFRLQIKSNLLESKFIKSSNWNCYGISDELSLAT